MNPIKYLQLQGIGSRKTCQTLLRYEAVCINGNTVSEHDDIDSSQVRSLNIDGQEKVVIPLPYYYIVLNKPSGYETSHKPRDYPSVFSLLPDQLRATAIQAVGRLDADTTGVLLLTNDGGFNHRMTSPKHHIAKHYRASLKHPADESLCAKLKQGVLLHDDNETVTADEAVLENSTTLLLTITQGKYHQVKRMVAAAGNRVEALHRYAFGSWQADGLAIGQWRFFHPEAAVSEVQAAAFAAPDS